MVGMVSPRVTLAASCPQDENGNEPEWTKAHAIDNELIWGEHGWCEAEDPKHKCASALSLAHFIPGMRHRDWLQASRHTRWHGSVGLPLQCLAPDVGTAPSAGALVSLTASRASTATYPSSARARTSARRAASASPASASAATAGTATTAGSGAPTRPRSQVRRRSAELNRLLLHGAARDARGCSQRGMDCLLCHSVASQLTLRCHSHVSRRHAGGTALAGATCS